MSWKKLNRLLIYRLSSRYSSQFYRTLARCWSASVRATGFTSHEHVGFSTTEFTLNRPTSEQSISALSHEQPLKHFTVEFFGPADILFSRPSKLLFKVRVLGSLRPSSLAKQCSVRHLLACDYRSFLWRVGLYCRHLLEHRLRQCAYSQLPFIHNGVWFDVDIKLDISGPTPIRIRVMG